ncbi:MAG: hypothetical protein K2H52_16030 [Lachnospiraceae bacterium]|nr:hypothetical protein [Lachnospiraceae bacterium]
MDFVGKGYDSDVVAFFDFGTKIAVITVENETIIFPSRKIPIYSIMQPKFMVINEQKNFIISIIRLKN